MEREKNKNKGRMIALAAVGACAAVLLILAAVFVFPGTGLKNRGGGTVDSESAKDTVFPAGCIMIVDGREIGRNEYLYHLLSQKTELENYYGQDIWDDIYEDGQTYGEYLTAATLDYVRMLNIYVARAEAAGIKVPDGSEEAAAEYMEAQKLYLGQDNLDAIGITDGEMLRIIKQNYLINTIRADIYGEYILDEEDFNEFCLEDFELNYVYYVTVSVDYILTETEEEAETVMELAEGGLDFRELVREHSTDYTAPEPGGYDPRSVSTPSYMVFAFTDEIFYDTYEMEEGEIRGPYKADGGFIVVRADSVEIPSIEDVKDEKLEQYTNDRKRELAESEYEKWEAEAEYEINRKMVEGIDIRDIGAAGNSGGGK